MWSEARDCRRAILAAKREMWEALSREARSYVQERKLERKAEMETVAEAATAATHEAC